MFKDISKTYIATRDDTFLKPPPLVTAKTMVYQAFGTPAHVFRPVTKLPSEPAPVPPFLRSPASLPITRSSARTFDYKRQAFFQMPIVGDAGIYADFSVART